MEERLNLSEEEAVNALLGELIGEEATKDVQPEKDTEETKEEKPQSMPEVSKGQDAQTKDEAKEDTNTKKASLLEELNQEVANNKAAVDEQNPVDEQNTQGKEPIDQDFEALKAMGLDSLVARLQAQEKELQAQKALLEQQKAIAEAREEFATNLSKFKSEFPTIDPDSMGEWAEKNGFERFLKTYDGWKLTAMAMLNQSKPQQSPDPITSSSGKSAEISAFDKLKKGESVNEIELGAELLKLAEI